MDSFKKQIRTATGLMRRNAGAFIPRRGFLRLAGAAAAYSVVRSGEYAVTETFTRLVVDPALADRMAGLHLATPVSLKALKASAPESAIRIAAEAWRENPAIEYVIHALRKAGQHSRYTLAAEDSAGRVCIVHQGAGSRRLWNYAVEGIPMDARPDDPGLGAFLLRRYVRAHRSSDPLLENVALFPARADLPDKFRYVGFAATDGRQIIGVTVPSDPVRSGSDGNDPAHQGPSNRQRIDRQPANQPRLLSA